MATHPLSQSCENWVEDGHPGSAALADADAGKRVLIGRLRALVRVRPDQQTKVPSYPYESCGLEHRLLGAIVEVFST